MKIGLVTAEYPGKTVWCGGIGVHFQQLACALSAQGHDVHVILVDCRQTRAYTEEGICFHEIRTSPPAWLRGRLLNYLVPAKELFRAWVAGRFLRKIVHDSGIEVIETTSYMYSSLLYSFRKDRCPLVVRVSTLMLETYRQEHGKLTPARKISCALEKRFIEDSDAALTHTRAHCEAVRGLYGLEHKEFEIIPHGIELPDVSAGRGPEKAGRVNVLFLGRLERRKGIDLLLEAIPAVLEKNNRIRFLIAGSDFKGLFKDEFARKTGGRFSDRVDFLGSVSEAGKKSLYEECDIFVAPSRYESFGLVFLEAMSFRKPVVGFSVGGVPEVVADGECGLLGKEICSGGLAEMILRLSGDDGLRTVMGEAGRLRAEQLFSSERMAVRSLEFYLRVVNRCAAASGAAARSASSTGKNFQPAAEDCCGSREI